MNYIWDFAMLGKYSHLFWLGLGWTIAYTIRQPVGNAIEEHLAGVGDRGPGPCI